MQLWVSCTIARPSDVRSAIWLRANGGGRISQFYDQQMPTVYGTKSAGRRSFRLLLGRGRLAVPQLALGDLALKDPIKQRSDLRILFVGYAESIHTARWTAQLEGKGWDLHVFGVTHARPNVELRDVTVHRLVQSPLSRAVVRQEAIHWPLPRGETRVTQVLERIERYSPAARLARLIDELRPDIVHSLEMQLGGYLTWQARQRTVSSFPTWIYSCWGNDLFHFGCMLEHQQSIRDVLTHCDYMITDCRRDVQLARDFGFAGALLGTYPTGGGFDLARMRTLRQEGSVAARRVIAVKGYNGGPYEARGLVAIEALRRTAPLLRDYEVVVYSAVPEVSSAVENLRRSCGVRATVSTSVIARRYPPVDGALAHCDRFGHE